MPLLTKNLTIANQEIERKMDLNNVVFFMFYVFDGIQGFSGFH